MKNEQKLRKATKTVLVHFTGNRETDYHQIKKDALREGILEIGFHYIIEGDGTLLMGRHQSQVGSYNSEFDEVSVGICVAAERDGMTDEQSIALTLILDKLRNDYPAVESVKYIYRTT
ncbi:MAG: hypothetical protein NPINA01_00050 [Nitrospinaceae bacterium]|nr:MAG: hypothetical protein NPINA01_00050 [Nitrospinaceae bacterium]